MKTDNKGATAIEYGLIAALMAVAIITAVALLGTNLKGTFKNISDKLSGEKDDAGKKEEKPADRETRETGPIPAGR